MFVESTASQLRNGLDQGDHPSTGFFEECHVYGHDSVAFQKNEVYWIPTSIFDDDLRLNSRSVCLTR